MGVCVSKNILGAGFALRGEALSLACPRESTQREGHPAHSSAGADALRSSPIRGRAQLGRQACLKQGARLVPDCLRYSVSADGPWVEDLGFRFFVLTLSPLAQPSITVETASCASAGLHEKRREPALAGKPLGPRFFWILFFGGAKKSISPTGRNPQLKNAKKKTITRYRGKSEHPIKYSSTARAHCRPSRIAHTTSDCPRRISPAVNTLSIDVWY